MRYLEIALLAFGLECFECSAPSRPIRFPDAVSLTSSLYEAIELQQSLPVQTKLPGKIVALNLVGMMIAIRNCRVWVPGIRYFAVAVLLSVAVVLFIAIRPTYADIYTYTDSQGVLHFTNVPTSPQYTVYIKERRSRRLSSYSTNRYDHLIAGASKRHGVAFPLLKAMIKTESDFNPWAVSRAGAKGLMQIMPANIKALNIKNPFDPWENIKGGAKYLKQLIDRFGGDLQLAIAAYNAGPNIVERHQGIPPIKETEDFVRKVLEYYSIY